MSVNNPFSPGALVAFYGRDSGGDTQELSVLQQETVFQAWCTENALIPGSIFKDVARPGSSVVGRSSFQDMIHYFHSGQAKEAGLVIWSYSRFAREFDDSTFYRADLRRRGFIFFSMNDDIPEGSIGKLFEAIIDWKNEMYLVDLSHDTKRGLHDLVVTYGAVPGTPPRGFKRERMIIGKRRDGRDRIAHRWIPDPELVPRVQLAFKMRAAGQSLDAIHKATLIYGSYNSYNTFFKNKIYIGILEFGDRVIENYCEPVIDRPTWDLVQAKIYEFAKHRNLKGPNHPRRINSSYLLSGLADCARCGSPLYGTTSKGSFKPDGTRNSDYDRYACTRAYRRHDCDQGQFSKKILDQAVIETLCNYVLQPEVLSQIQQQIVSNRDTYLTRINEQRGEIKASLTGLRRRITNLTDAIAESGHTRALLEKLAGLEDEEIALLAKAAELDRQASSQAPEIATDQLGDMAEQLRDLIVNADLQTRQQILRAFVDKISVDRDGKSMVGTITYYFPPAVELNNSPPEGDKESCTYIPLPVGSARLNEM